MNYFSTAFYPTHPQTVSFSGSGRRGESTPDDRRALLAQGFTYPEQHEVLADVAEIFSGLTGDPAELTTSMENLGQTLRKGKFLSDSEIHDILELVRSIVKHPEVLDSHLSQTQKNDLQKLVRSIVEHPEKLNLPQMAATGILTQEQLERAYTAKAAKGQLVKGIATGASTTVLLLGTLLALAPEGVPFALLGGVGTALAATATGTSLHGYTTYRKRVLLAMQNAAKNLAR